MISHRKSTRMQPEQPVRFYKTIAITFLILTIVLLGVVIFFTSKKATIVVVAKSDNKNVNLSIDVSEDQNMINTITGIVTSTDFVWSETYYPTGNKTIEGVATGVVTIYNDSVISQPLVKTTRLLTPAGVLFRLTEGVTVPANGSITAKVYADKIGGTGDIGKSDFTIPGLSESSQKLIYAKSISNMSGGTRKVGMLTSDDLQAAKNNFLLKVKKAYLDSLPKNTNTKMEQVLSVQTGTVSSDKKVGEQVDGFIISGTSTVVMVYYNKAELQTIVNNDLAKKIDTTVEKLLSIGKEPQVNLASYNLINNTARLSVYQDVLVTLDANGNKLAAANFFGKSKEEIKKYIMGLSHVVGVEVKFTPSWMRKAPSVTDRIKVIVKNVK